MDKNKMHEQDDAIRKLFSRTTIHAGENLKYRIMQQIETESLFSVKKAENKNTVASIKSMLSVFGVMYALIAIVGIGTYMTGGIEALKSAAFFAPIILISSVCCLFLMISIFDDKLRSKRTKQNQAAALENK